MRSARATIAAALILVTACSSEDTTPSDSTVPVFEEQPTVVNSSELNYPPTEGVGDATDSIDGPVIRHARPIDQELEEMLVEVAGALKLVDGCLLLVSGESDEWAFPLVWPAGTLWDRDTLAVEIPGRVVIPVGADIAGGGGFLSLESVRLLAGDAASSEAARCLQPGAAEQIVVFNNTSTAVSIE